MTAAIVDYILDFLSRFFGLRFGFLRDNSMGRQAVNLEFWLRKNKGNLRQKTIFFSSCEPANSFIYELQSREVKIIQSRFIYKILKIILEKNEKPRYLLDLSSTGFYFWNEWSTSGPQLQFNLNDLQNKLAYFKKFSIPEDKKIICIHARSHFYVDTVGAKRDPYWQANDFRDCDIANFERSIDWLVEEGYFVVLLNHPDHDKPFLKKDKNILDLGVLNFSNKDERDRLTLYLTSSCFFLLGNTSGIYLLASIFDIPVAYTNLIPLGECGRKKTDLFILKRYFDHKKKQFLPFKEIIEIGGDMDTLNEEQLGYLKKNDIEIIESSSEEILGLTKEIVSRLNGTYLESSEYLDLKTKFHHMFPEKHPMRSFPSPIAESFLICCREDI